MNFMNNALYTEREVYLSNVNAIERTPSPTRCQRPTEGWDNIHVSYPWTDWRLRSGASDVMRPWHLVVPNTDIIDQRQSLIIYKVKLTRYVTCTVQMININIFYAKYSCCIFQFRKKPAENFEIGTFIKVKDFWRHYSEQERSKVIKEERVCGSHTRGNSDVPEISGYEMLSQLFSLVWWLGVPDIFCCPVSWKYIPFISWDFFY